MKNIVALLLVVHIFCSARQEEERGLAVREGNLALRSSQQPGPLFSFGQTNIDEGDFQGFGYIGHNKGKTFRSTDIIPFITYGMTDELALSLIVPITVQLHEDNRSKEGMADIILQAEYVVHYKEREHYGNQVSVLFAASLPTGFSTTLPPLSAGIAFTATPPPLGAGVPTFFIGATASHMATDWYFFVSPAILFSTRNFTNKQGTSFFYEFGLGKNISYSEKHIFTWILEFDGAYIQRSKICNVSDPDTGGVIFAIGPSLWYSREQFIIQAGFSVPVSQILFGDQDREQFFAAVNVGWTFNT